MGDGGGDVAPDQPAGVTAGVHGGAGETVVEGRAVFEGADEAADVFVADDGAGGLAVFDVGGDVGQPGERADEDAAGDGGAGDGEVADGAAADVAEQPDKGGAGPVDEEVGDDAALAVVGTA